MKYRKVVIKSRALIWFHEILNPNFTKKENAFIYLRLIWGRLLHTYRVSGLHFSLFESLLRKI